MELRHLRYFMAVVEERSFTRAASRLKIAQSPLSRQIRQLEREIGAQLLHRTTRSVSVTHAGEVFYERAAAVFESTAQAAEDARSAERGEYGTLAVGLTGSATYELLPALARAHGDRYPEVALQVHSDLATPEQTELLLDGRLHVGVLRPPVRAQGLALEVVRHEPVMVVLASRHPATVNREIDLAELRDEPFIAPTVHPPSTMYTLMREACESAGFTPRISQVVAGSTALVALAAADMGVALVPASLRHLRVNGATFRPLRSPQLTTALALAYPQHGVNPLVQRFLDTARAVVHSRDAVESLPALDRTADDLFIVEM